MIGHFTHPQKPEQTVAVQFNAPIDISMPLRAGDQNANCFWAPAVQIEPVRSGNFIGDTTKGGLVNFKNVSLNPHGNGTHTECVGHIATQPYYLPQRLTNYLFFAELATVYPTLQTNGDRIITLDTLAAVLNPDETNNLLPALVLRTMPNPTTKLTQNYSGTNPPYIHHQAVSWLVSKGVQHLLIDLPSVDREQDEGLLLAHKAFWQYPHGPIRTQCTITELIYVPNQIKDGQYLLQFQITSLELDASPSKPVLYALA
ncbi:MAG TPA: cyclase family protein [Chitinophagales bacterium]|nr:cyclase family protein [Chitinophagales bacterium]